MVFRDVMRILNSNGWKKTRICESSYQFSKFGVSNSIIITGNENKKISVAVLKDLEKKAGISFVG